MLARLQLLLVLGQVQATRPYWTERGLVQICQAKFLTEIISLKPSSKNSPQTYMSNPTKNSPIEKGIQEGVTQNKQEGDKEAGLFGTLSYLELICKIRGDHLVS